MNPLLRAILDNPEDDTVRLVYSDWLEEHGDQDRSEFIRAQIDVHHEHGTELVSPARKRADELLQKHGFAWSHMPGKPTYTPPRTISLGIVHVRLPYQDPHSINSLASLTFRRGFIESITLPSRAFTQNTAESLFSNHPITRVTLTDVEDHIDHRTWPVPAWVGISEYNHRSPSISFAETGLSRTLVQAGKQAAGLLPQTAKHP